MPFITEELYQRLPHPHPFPRAVSIAVAPFPEQNVYHFRNTELEQEMDFVQKVVHSIRSARSDYSLAKGTKTEAFVKSEDAVVKDTLARFSLAITTLAYCSRLDLSEPPPPGCAILTVSEKCEVHVNFKGLIDPEKELIKLSKKEEFLRGSIVKLEQAMSVADYETKVPEEVRAANTDKMAASRGELERLTQAMASLHTMH